MWPVLRVRFAWMTERRRDHLLVIMVLEGRPLTVTMLKPPTGAAKAESIPAIGSFEHLGKSKYVETASPLHQFLLTCIKLLDLLKYGGQIDVALCPARRRYAQRAIVHFVSRCEIHRNCFRIANGQ